MTGRMYNEKLGQFGAVIVFVGFNLTFFTQFILGTQGMPEGWFEAQPEPSPTTQRPRRSLIDSLTTRLTATAKGIA
jgi:heme/copper-type cytochrome/quinol oxidase subunit 1